MSLLPGNPDRAGVGGGPAGRRPGGGGRKLCTSRAPSRRGGVEWRPTRGGRPGLSDPPQIEGSQTMTANLKTWALGGLLAIGALGGAAPAARADWQDNPATGAVVWVPP